MICADGVKGEEEKSNSTSRMHLSNAGMPLSNAGMPFSSSFLRIIWAAECPAPLLSYFALLDWLYAEGKEAFHRRAHNVSLASFLEQIVLFIFWSLKLLRNLHSVYISQITMLEFFWFKFSNQILLLPTENHILIIYRPIIFSYDMANLTTSHSSDHKSRRNGIHFCRL